VNQRTRTTFPRREASCSGGAASAHETRPDPATLFLGAASGDLQLLATAPAVGAGVASFGGADAPATDVLGAPRPFGGTFDIGAYEQGATAPPSGAGGLTGGVGGGASGGGGGNGAGGAGRGAGGNGGGGSSGGSGGNGGAAPGVSGRDVSGGCGCRTSDRGGTSGALLIGLLLLGCARRRR